MIPSAVTQGFAAVGALCVLLFVTGLWLKALGRLSVKRIDMTAADALDAQLHSEMWSRQDVDLLYEQLKRNVANRGDGLLTVMEIVQTVAKLK